MSIPEELAILRDEREAEAGISFDVAVRRFLRNEQKVVSDILKSSEMSRIIVPTEIWDDRFIVIRSAYYRVDGGRHKGGRHHCFIDIFTGDVLPQSNAESGRMIVFEPAGHIFDDSNGSCCLVYSPDGGTVQVRDYTPAKLANPKSWWAVVT